MRILVVEDSQERIDWFRTALIGFVVDVAVTAEEGIAFLREHEYYCCYLDHDLAPEDYTEDTSSLTSGHQVVLWLENNPENNLNCNFIVHSLNPSGSQRMVNGLERQRRNVIKTSYLQLRKLNEKLHSR